MIPLILSRSTRTLQVGCRCFIYAHFWARIVEGDRLGRYVYREWLRLHDGRPPFQRHSFFAKAVQIGDNGPRNLEKLTAFHEALCGVILSHLDDVVDFCPEFDQEMGMNPVTERPPLFGPRPSQRVQSWRNHGHTMGHLFRALYMIVDDQSHEREDVAQYLETEHDRRLSQCTVPLVKTGDEAHLHSPISFLPLFGAGLNEQDELCEAWVNRVMKHAEDIGLEANRYTWLATRCARARLNGEAFDDDQVNPFWAYGPLGRIGSPSKVSLHLLGVLFEFCTVLDILPIFLLVLRSHSAFLTLQKDMRHRLIEIVQADTQSSTIWAMELPSISVGLSKALQGELAG